MPKPSLNSNFEQKTSKCFLGSAKIRQIIQIKKASFSRKETFQTDARENEGKIELAP